MNGEPQTAEIFSTTDAAHADRIAAVLQQAGIECEVVRQTPRSGNSERTSERRRDVMVRVPVGLEETARGIIQEQEPSTSVFRIASWTCPKCGTEVDSEISSCWQCFYCPAAC